MLGLLLALILDVPITFLEAKGWSRPLSSFIFAVLAFMVFPAILTLFFLKIWRELQALSNLWSFGELAAGFSEWLPMLQAEFDQGSLLQLPVSVLKWALTIPELFFVWTLAAFSAYFFCRDKKAFTKFFVGQLPKSRRFKLLQAYHSTAGALMHLLRVQFLLMFISTSISMVFFSVLRLPYALLSGFLVGFFDLCPLVGPGLVYFGLAIIYLWLGNTSVAAALIVGYLILLLVRQWGEPHLVSGRLGLHPLVALMALYIGLRVWGPLGAIAGPMIMVFLKALLSTRSNIVS